MSIEDDSPQANETESTRVAPLTTNDSAVGGLLVIGLVLVAAGVISGLILAVQVAPDGCDQSFQSCTHPHVALGVILVGASVFAGVILALVAMIARRVLQSLPARHE